jgi:isoleucyl-tRNA synthetase
MGADVMRWTYCSQNPQLNLRFGYTIADETRRKLLTLWNVYSFFVIYASIDRFDPSRRAMPVKQRGDLDRWIISQLNVLVGRVRDRLDALDTSSATRAVDTFVENLSNWYVRRSRRRFWKSEEDADKVAAHLTLYEVLTTLARLLAPFMPFLTEEMYQNLVRSVDPSAPASVHHTEYPVANPDLIDEGLMADVGLVQRIVNLGRSARGQAQVRVRQPLGQVLVKVARPGEQAALRRLAPQVLDELNVQRLDFVQTHGELVSYSVRPRAALLGPKYGRELPRIVAAIQAADESDLAERVLAGQEVRLEGYTLLPDELEVMAQNRPNYVVVVDGDYAVGLSTALTPALVEEGQVRELVHRVQTMRRAADFRIEEQILTYYSGDPEIMGVVAKHADYVKHETLSRELCPGLAPAGAKAESFQVDGKTVTVGVSRE